MIRLEMKNMWYDIKREAAKLSELLSGKIDKFEYLTGEEVLPFNQRQIIKQAKFLYSIVSIKDYEKLFKKQTEKQVAAIRSLKPFNKKDELKKLRIHFHKVWWMIWLVLSLKKFLIGKILLKHLSYIINQNVEKFIILMSLCLFFFKRNTWRTFIIKGWWYEQTNFADKWNNLGKRKKQLENS